MSEYIKKEDVLKILYDIKENKDIPKNYGTLIDVIQLVRKLPSEEVISKSMGKCELAIAQNNNLHTDCNYCIELAKVEAYQEITNELHIAFDKHFGTGFYKRSCRDVIDDVLKEKKFISEYCNNCGSQRCEGINSEWFEGCKYKDFLNT